MLGFPQVLNVFALILASLLGLDLPRVSPGAKPKQARPEHTLEEATATRLWVPASKISFRNGSLDPRVFPEGELNMFQGLLRERIEERGAPLGVSLIPPSSCATNLWVERDEFAGGWTFDEMLKDSTGIYSGSIVSQEPGFFNAVPVLFMRVKIESIILAAPGYRGDFLDIFYPHAHFRVQGRKVCGIKDDGGFEPRIGDRVLVFAARPFPERGTPAWMPAPERIALESSDGRLYLPNALRLDRRLFAVESLSEIEKVLRHILSAAPEVIR